MPALRVSIEGAEMSELKCGCEPGRPCDVALKLLGKAIDLRDKYSETGDAKDWEAYLEIKRRYDAHREGLTT